MKILNQITVSHLLVAIVSFLALALMFNKSKLADQPIDEPPAIVAFEFKVDSAPASNAQNQLVIIDGVEIERHPNSEFTSYHIRQRIVPEFDVYMTNPLGSAVIKADGVVSVSTWPYEISISKANMYEWPEVDSNVLAEIRKWRSNK